AKESDADVTGMSSGQPIRVLRYQRSREYLRMEKEGASFEELEQLTLGSLRKAVMDGDVKNGSLMAGQCAGLVKKQQSCKEIVEELMTEADELLNR
uniref:nitronate monooxygenase n=1 Tax=Roseburia sp. TaxID=2049040 RepID=UPI003FED5C79